MKKHLKTRLSTAIGFTSLIAMSSSYAQLEEVIVTATKQVGGAAAQDVPIAITALGEQQIENMHLRDIKAVGFSAPNVQLEDIGTARGGANFSIRGLGVNSSIATIDPTVGTFIDGMYLGVNSGVVFDTFDLAGIEVLRGPQGLLFGRNVTGGAVLLRTTLPGDEFKAKLKFAIESGDNKITSGVFSGPLSDNAGAKIAIYHNDDGGYFKNEFTGKDHGAATTTILRAAFTYDTDNTQFIVRGERGEAEGDGPASQNTGLFQEGSFKFSIDNTGFYDNDWNQLSLETNTSVSLGDGTVTALVAYREYNGDGSVDIDASPLQLFDGPAKLFQDQISYEVRYAGTFGDAFVTTGLYNFQQDIDIREQRIIAFGTTDITGGGVQESENFGVFANVDYNLSEDLTLTVGGRYSQEDKDAKVAKLPLNLCTLDNGCGSFSFIDTESWYSFTPKVGVRYETTDTSHVYAHWTKGFRSGGYNFRDVSFASPPGPFDQEEQTSIEVGFKYDSPDDTMRFNAAVFHNEIDDLQRELNVPDPVVGVSQSIRNVADATIQGVELEAQWFVTEDFQLTAQYGYVDGEYDRVLENIDRTPGVTASDLALSLPRLAPHSYGAGFRWEIATDFGSVTVQSDYSHRDAAAYTDDNVGQLFETDMINANVTFSLMDDSLKVSLFGKNLKDEATIGGDTQLPAAFAQLLQLNNVPLNGQPISFSPLNKGRIWGIEFSYSI